MSVKLHLKKAGGSGEQLGVGGPSQFLLQAVKTFAEGAMFGKLHEADQVTATVTAVTVEQILAGVDVERRVSFRVQRAESYELLARRDAATGPMAPLQVLQQRNPFFELFQILTHGCCSFLC